MKIFALVFAVLLSFVAPAGAQAQNSWPATWNADGVFGYASCQQALDTSFERARAANMDPLVILQPTCPSATFWTDPPPRYRAEYRRTFDFPTTPSRAVDMGPECPPGAGLAFNSTRGWFCTPSEAMRNIGKCRNCSVGNPVDPGYGNKIQHELDYAGFGPFPLRLERVHNSARGHALNNSAGFADVTGIPSNWTHNYERKLAASGPTAGNNPQAPIVSFNTAAVSRPDGKQYAFNLVGGVWVSDVDLKGERLEQITGGWKLTTSEDEIEIYDTAGKLLSISNRAGLTQTLTYFTSGANVGLLQTVTDPFGRTLSFSYTDRRLGSVTIPGGGVISYGYASNLHKQLITVTYPDSTTRTYHYEGPVTGGYIRMLTGITDELGVRYATWVYDYDYFNSPYAGRPTLSQHAGGAGKVTVSYSGSSALVSTFVTSIVSETRTYGFQTNFGVITNNAITGASCPQCGPVSTLFDVFTGLPSVWFDWNGNRGSRGIDSARVLETGRTEARDAAAGTTPDTVYTPYTWHSTFRLQTVVGGPLRTTTNTYDATGSTCGARGALCSKSVQANTDATGFSGTGVNVGAPRVWTYTYNANGQVLTANGPRTDVADVTTYTYDGQGNVATVTNAAGHVTQITSYNVHGQPLTIVDPNGLTTTLAYDARQRLTSRTVGSEITLYEYDLAGQLKKVTMPDSSFLSYGYDDAHRLTSITDNLGNKITYTLDLAGNRTAEEVRDPGNTLVQTRTRAYSSLNRLIQEIGAAGQTTEFTYDPQGNALTVKDPLNKTTTNAYDRRNRLKQVTDPAKGVALYGYNGLSALISVTDPRSLATSYAVNGHGDLTQQVSPDTGTTGSTYDLAGNLATQTDAKSQVTTYAYDALNRVTLITFHDASSHTYVYDAGTNGLGRLTSITEKNPSAVTTAVLAYTYDLHGRVLTEARTVNSVTYTLTYTYDASGRLSGMTYPSGRSVAYSFDALGRVSQVDSTASGGSPQTVVQSVAYHPFGSAKSWTYGNTQTYSRTIDQDGRISAFTLGGVSSTVGYDAASRITGITPNTYGYDTLDRLTSAVLPASNYAYSYDAVGNRLTKTTGANTDTYTYGTTSNRIATLTPFGSPLKTFTLDANGSTTSDAVNSFTYDTRGRMVSSTNASALATAYQVNALGQRIRKTNANEDTVYTYDTWGKLIAETDAAGVLKREYVYVGDVPVGVVQGGALAFIQPDHLNTPRHVYDASSQLRWGWDQAEPFGVTPPNENPAALGTFEMPLRFAGQYGDKETGNSYNYFRDCYDPALGRYCQSDPIGLLGGLNTYAYVTSAPLTWMDPTGEAKKYEKPPNPNQRKGAEERKPTGERERNVKHPKGEEHSRRPKGGFRARSCIFIIWDMVQEFCAQNPGALECLILIPEDPDDPCYGRPGCGA